MATLLLAAAGAALGSAALPAGISAFGATLSGAAVGQAVGTALGGLIDAKLFGASPPSTQGPRLQDVQIQRAAEGTPIARAFGRHRLAGNIVWQTAFLETAATRKVGGKGGGGSAKTTEYSYSVSFAVALCEGEIAGIDRVWADGKLIDLADFPHRVYRGTEDQLPDPKILAVEGAARAIPFRGTAYVLFEDMPLAKFGNRIPQLQFEVVAPVPGGVEEKIKGVTIIPASGEFVYGTTEVTEGGSGEAAAVNANARAPATDWSVSMDQLQATARGIESAALVVSWFGTDLRCGSCRIRPGVEHGARRTTPYSWSAGGVGRAEAHRVSKSGGHVNFGGTPSDRGVFEAIKDLRRRGLRVVFYPFIMMDVPPDNALPDPWTGAAAQPAFPWRGRITLSAAPGRPGSPDRTSAAAAQVASFFGSAAPGHFGSWNGSTIPYGGPNEWSLRRKILHYAKLCKAAGGVDAFLIGSEMRSLTQIRSAASSYPAVAAFRSLAADVRSILGPATKISYAADWSEYFGHQPADGSGDLHFHLDPLWSDPNIDFVGIDNYFPMADWRDGLSHADAAAGSIYRLDYLRANIEGGEGYDWHYASEADRAAQRRTPITDGAYGEPWVFRPKDIRNWWSRAHHDRPGGVRSATPTGWSPESKPIWFTECGCPAVDKGANQPNVFYDPKSSESFIPHFSTGERDDSIQRAYLEALHGYWSDPANNAPGFVDASNIHVWTWDARPYPEFPARSDLWADAEAWRLGHWLTGRLGAASLAAVVREICRPYGVEPDVSRLEGEVEGYVVERIMSARAAIEPLAAFFRFDGWDSGDRIKFAMKARADRAILPAGELLAGAEGSGPLTITRGQEAEIPAEVKIAFSNTGGEYQRGAASAARPFAFAAWSAVKGAIAQHDFPIATSEARARYAAEMLLADAWTQIESYGAKLPPSALGIEPGDVLELGDGSEAAVMRVTRASWAWERPIEGVAVDLDLYAASAPPAPTPVVARAPAPSVRPLVWFADLPLLTDEELPHAPTVAGAASPWPGGISILRSATGEGFAEAVLIERPAAMGFLEADLAGAAAGLWQRGEGAVVRLIGGELASAAEAAVYGGANAAALEGANGDWEILQFQEAELIAEKTWALRLLLRGRRGTEHAIGAPTPAGARFFLLDSRALRQPDLPLGARGLPQYWRWGPANRAHDHASYETAQMTFQGVGLRPYAPARLRASLQSSGDLAVSWSRRSRGDADAWLTAEPPLNEEREDYRLEIRSGGALRRAASLTAPSFVYSAAARAADGADFPLEIAVAQVSATYGPGIATRIIVHG